MVARKTYLDAQLLEPDFPVQISCDVQITTVVPWSLYIYINVAIGFSENGKRQEMKNHFVA